jgi:serine/threonine protein kinase
VTASGGIRFGNYTLYRRLARGGMAEVFLARQVGLEGFDRRVAVKRILPHLADSREFTEMFLREAKLAARLSHPNIVHIYDFGKVGTDYFIAMEFVDGVTAGELIAYCAKDPMPAVLIARLGADAAVALHYAHELRGDSGKALGLVHRDVSPANVMVSYDGVIKVVDFGIAKAAELHDDKTNPGTVKGKYAYMSPEQTIAARLDGRSDVFSLSIVMWELVAARPIVERGDRVAAMRAIRDGRLPKLEQVAPQTPRALVEAINWGLARRREDRPDAAQLAQELEAFIKASPELGTSMHLASWVRPRFQSTVEVTEGASQDGGTSAGHTGAGPSTQASHSEEDLAATIPVQKMTAAELFGSHHGAAPTYYAPRTAGNPGNPGTSPRPATGATGLSTQAGQGQAGANRTAQPAQAARPVSGQSVQAPQLGPAAAAGRGASTARAPGEATAAGMAVGRAVGRVGASDASSHLDTEAVTALPPPRRAKMPSPAPVGTPQRTFSEAEQDDYASTARRRLLVAGIAVALIASAFLFTLFVVQPLLRDEQPPAQPGRTSGQPTVAPIDVPPSPAPAGNARLSVSTTPPSQVVLDERVLGPSPIGELELPAGTHKLTFLRDGRPPVTREVTLKPGEALQLNVDLLNAP